jgi:hypothetical protein
VTSASARAVLVVAWVALVAAGTAGCSGDSRPAEWGYISPVIMEPNCATASCHSRAAAVSGLDFSDADRGYKSLTSLWVWVPNPNAMDQQTLDCGKAGNGVPVCEEHFRPLVTPYVPDESRLVNVLRGRGAPRMPPDRPLNEADIRLIEQWILDGARRDNRMVAAMDAGRGDAIVSADAADGPADGTAADSAAADMAADGAGSHTDAGADVAPDANDSGAGG